MSFFTLRNTRPPNDRTIRNADTEQNIAMGKRAAYFLCSLILAYPIGRMAHNRRKGYVFRVKWYHKAASTYVLALPIFLLLVYLIGKVSG